ncbi:hypothetical protein HMPREF2661_07560 [Neisseria sp. HMSC061B04]|nr:hypothetical protein HMPREF2661_07560 [Neisseria sp. HMSC061B04]
MIKKTETTAAQHPPVCLERIMLPKQQKRSSENAIWFSDDLVGLITAIWRLGRFRSGKTRFVIFDVQMSSRDLDIKSP